jgi:hypothetical protein
MFGKGLRKAGVLVAVVGTLAIGFRGGDFSLQRTAIAIAVAVALFAAGVAVEERRG